MSDSKAGPFSGLVVVDLTRVLAGPYCAMLLAELGADVIKVEPPGKGDDARVIGPFVHDKSAYFMSLNRGKRSIALDLKAPDHRAIFETLLARADILLENYRGGALEKLGYGWDVLEARYPKLIYCAVSGFGQTGPYKTRPAYDMVVQAMGGIMSLTGQPGGQPTRVGTSVGDITAGLFAAIGISSALYRRKETGRGMMVDVAMLDCQVAILENAIARYVATGEVPGPLGARHPSITPFAAFATKDGHIVIAAGNDDIFAKLAKALRMPEIADDPNFSTNRARCENWLALHAAIETALGERGTAQWLKLIEAAGVPCGPINDMAAVLADPQVLARNMIVSATDAKAGLLKMPGNPIKLSAYDDPATRAPAPALDADRAAILKWLGVTD